MNSPRVALVLAEVAVGVVLQSGVTVCLNTNGVVHEQRSRTLEQVKPSLKFTDNSGCVLRFSHNTTEIEGEL